MQDYENEKNARKILEVKIDKKEKKLADAARKLKNTRRKSKHMREQFEMKLQENAKLIHERVCEELDDFRGQLEAFGRMKCCNYATEAVDEGEALLEEILTTYKVIHEDDDYIRTTH